MTARSKRFGHPGLLGKTELGRFGYRGLRIPEREPMDRLRAFLPGKDSGTRTENGMYKKAAGHYEVLHEGNYNPVFKLFEATGTVHAYISIETDKDDGSTGLSVNGVGPIFYQN